LAALALFMLLLFEPEAAIASACILTSGILVLLLSVLHALLRSSQISQISRISRSEPSQALYENDSAQPGHGELGTGTAAPGVGPGAPRAPRDPPVPPSPEPPRGPARTHRTLSADSGLLRGHGGPWGGIAGGTRSAGSRRAPGKDSTLV
ncbi:TM221 protein, partial [Dicaeum eximium]|nr:TM221 protein [Dicaeum eximium]